jgi:hypothetical protein
MRSNKMSFTISDYYRVFHVDYINQYVEETQIRYVRTIRLINASPRKLALGNPYLKFCIFHPVEDMAEQTHCLSSFLTERAPNR